MQRETAIVRALIGAGERVILPAFARGGSGRAKLDGSVVTETDLACQRHLTAALAELEPTTPLLGEEMSAHEQRAMIHRGGRYWCLDPLDGTSNFVAGFPMFAISLALIEDGQPVEAYIHDPVRKETFAARRGGGTRLNGRPVRCTASVPPTSAVGFIDFKRLPDTLAERLLMPGAYRSQRNIGSCALEWAWLAAGRAHFIIHGGEKLWDYAAGSLLAAESGCVVGDFRGRPLFPSEDISSSILACCDHALRHHLTQLLEGRESR